MSNRQVAKVLRISLGFVWIHTGVICLFVAPIEGTATLASRVGLAEPMASWTVWVTSTFEIMLGVAVLAGIRPRLLTIVQLVLIGGFTALISVFLSEFWLHPFGPVSKNVVLMAAAFAVGRLSTEQPSRRATEEADSSDSLSDTTERL